MTARKGGTDAALVAALAAGASVQAAARAGGISERTAFRRLEDPAFCKLVDDARSDIVRRAVTKLSAASTEAAETLRKLLYSDQDFCRLAAARSILELSTKMREHLVLVEEVAELRRTIEEIREQAQT